MEEVLRVFKAAADPTRLRILKMLAVKPLCVCEVMSVLGMAQSTASKHLRILADAGLIEARPGGTWTVYRLVKPRPESAAAHVLDLVKRAEETAQSKQDEERAKKADRNRLCQKRPDRTFSRASKG